MFNGSDDETQTEVKRKQSHVKQVYLASNCAGGTTNADHFQTTNVVISSLGETRNAEKTVPPVNSIVLQTDQLTRINKINKSNAEHQKGHLSESSSVTNQTTRFLPIDQFQPTNQITNEASGHTETIGSTKTCNAESSSSTAEIPLKKEPESAANPCRPIDKRSGIRDHREYEEIPGISLKDSSATRSVVCSKELKHSFMDKSLSRKQFRDQSTLNDSKLVVKLHLLRMDMTNCKKMFQHKKSCDQPVSYLLQEKNIMT